MFLMYHYLNPYNAYHRLLSETSFRTPISTIFDFLKLGFNPEKGEKNKRYQTNCFIEISCKDYNHQHVQT